MRRFGELESWSSPTLQSLRLNDLNDRRESRRLPAGLRVRVPLRDLRVEVLDRHPRRKCHRLFPKAADVELVGGGRVEDQLTFLLERAAVERDHFNEAR